MTDPDTPETPPGEPKVLGRLSPGAFDTTLGGQAAPDEAPPLRLPPPVSPDERPVERRSRRRRAGEASEHAGLPRGALVALYRSGGLVFRTSSVVVYRDGRVTYDYDGPGGERAQAVWVLSDAELDQLRAMIDAIDWKAIQFAHTAQRSDAYAYELFARHGRHLRRLETAEGAIPAQAEPLIRQVVAYAEQG
jgi:hypothetical protein